MKVTNGAGAVTRIYIEGAQALDAITVLMEDMQPGVGRITIICWGKVWTSFFGGMSGDTIRQFILRTGDDYISSSLWNDQRPKKADKVYLLRIISAVKSGLIQAEQEGI
ncbi:hypothetical protein CH54_1435 [Yersinia rochesterensis]|uniref:Uncharacterized protein n=2 Tax=Yersinia rochesterensis TaxID=1604335 RepID=A0ABM7DLU4_9GAMM|nr:hypothetical protein DJ57_2282 [Yersinia rochesterensis]AJI86734.1 hypothetical protein AW19_229 [Yersinia frederiksenii Y225]AJJ34219.1 hypothetical protein CH54_1435 [Yersinia rochesterensis]